MTEKSDQQSPLQRVPTFSAPQPFNTGDPHVVVTPSHKVLLLLLYNCHFATVSNCNVNINCTVNIQDAGSHYATAVVGGRDPQVENQCLPSEQEVKNKGSSQQLKVTSTADEQNRQLAYISMYYCC